MDNTEEKILSAARKIFTTKGLDGARMQNIADEAGINKALLHYYFRSKMKLFDVVIKETIADFIPVIDKILESDIPLEEKIKLSIEKYFDMLQKNPQLPIFILGEINRDSERFIEIMSEFKEIRHLASSFNKTFLSAGKRIEEPAQYFTSIISMIIFPYIAKPLIRHAFFSGNENTALIYMESRKQFVIKYALKLLED